MARIRIIKICNEYALTSRKHKIFQNKRRHPVTGYKKHVVLLLFPHISITTQMIKIRKAYHSDFVIYIHVLKKNVFNLKE